MKTTDNILAQKGNNLHKGNVKKATHMSLLYRPIHVALIIYLLLIIRLQVLLNMP